MNEHRELRFGVRASRKERVTGKEFRNNAVSSTKYTWWNFIVKCLLEQFRRFANLFFLLVGLLPLIKGVSNIRPEAAMAPITIVLTLSMIRELVEDLRRAATDRRINARDATILVRSNSDVSPMTVPWRDVAVGDIVHIHADEAVPADVVILQTALPSGLCYIETANLDGETNLKIHEAPRALPESIALAPATALTGALTCELPNNRLYQFEGSLQLDSHADPIAISHSNVILRGCVLRNTPRVTGVVVYTGKDTKLVKNSVAPPSKRSTLEHAMDYAIGVIFLIDILVCSVAAVLSQLNPLHEHNYVHNGNPSLASSGTVGGGFFTFVSFMVLFNQMIPLSLYVSLEAAKIFQAMYMQEDLNMYHDVTDTPAKANNSSLTEELGQIEMVMSDKTGTLTQNSMVFQCLAVKDRSYDLRLDADAALRHSRASLDRDIAASSSLGAQLRSFWLSLALCHTVIVQSDVAAAVEKMEGDADAQLPVSADETTKYQAESPDEAALVLAAKLRGFELRQRRVNVVVVRVDGKDLEFDILAINEFDSTRKRMSVLVRFPDHSIFLIVKGADSVIESALATDSDEHPDDFRV
jgi:phospholipid-transporting ATPase